MSTRNVTPRSNIGRIAAALAFILPLFAFAAAPEPTVEVRLQVYLDGREVSVQKVVSAATDTGVQALPIGVAPSVVPLTPSPVKDVDYLATDSLGRSLIP